MGESGSAMAVDSIIKAMDIISSSNLNGLAFDETIECEIVDNSDAKNGHYWVTDGSSRFEAYSEKNSYAKGAKVLVKIPCGNYSSTKYIEGLAEVEEGQPITYLSAVNTIVDIVELTQKKPINYTNSNQGIGLIANSSEKTKLIWSFDFSEPGNENLWLSDIYTSFYLEADFKTNLNNVKKGTYGLYFEIGIKLNDGNLLTQYYNLNSTEFFGNPYRFSFFTNQSKKFNIKNFKKFETIKLFFSQGADFKNITDGDYPIDKAANIFVNNIKVGLGTDLVDIPDNTVKLITLYPTGYGVEGIKDGDIYSDQVQLDFLWYNKTDENKYLGFSDGVASLTIDNDTKDNIFGVEEDEEIISYNTSSCGVTLSDTTVSTRNYDEEEYLKLTQAEERLQQQKNENMPFDKNSLSIMADIKDAHNDLKKISDLINKDFKSAFETLKSNLGETTINFDDWNELITSLGLEKHINNSLLTSGDNPTPNTEFSFLKYYENVFKYIATLQKSLKDNPHNDLKEIDRKIPDSFINLNTLLSIPHYEKITLNTSTYKKSTYYYLYSVFISNTLINQTTIIHLSFQISSIFELLK